METRQVRRARERSLVRSLLSKKERRGLFRRSRPERREIITALLKMIASGELKTKSRV